MTCIVGIMRDVPQKVKKNINIYKELKRENSQILNSIVKNKNCFFRKKKLFF